MSVQENSAVEVLQEKQRVTNCLAPIRKEFLLKCSSSDHQATSAMVPDKVDTALTTSNEPDSCDTSSVAKNGDQVDEKPPESKRARRGMNKNRPRDPCPDPKTVICFSHLENKCRFGDNCKFSHDITSFWASKPDDLGPVCPVFDVLGFCKYGVACRYAKNHVDNKLTNLKRENDSLLSQNSEESHREVNKLDADLKLLLQKRKYDHSLSESVLKSVKADSSDKIGAEITSSEKRLPKKMTGEDFKDKLYLAPLTTVGNLPFRRICMRYGAEITCGEMALATELLQGNSSEWALLRRHPSEKFFGVQICGGYPDTLTKCAQLLVDKCDVDFVDLNVGCPIDLICEKGAGCSLMNKPRKLEEIARCLDRILGDIPLTMKMRTGVHSNKNTAHTLIGNLQSCNLAMCTVHGRSREQRYTKLADWSYVNTCAKASQTMPVFGCGDILSFEDYYGRLEENRDIAGVVLARGALIKPWIFTEIKERRHWDIRSGERLDLMKEYVKFGLEHWGSDQKGVDTTRRFLLEWLSFSHRYIPVGLLERAPQKINERPPPYFGRDELESRLASSNCREWVKLSEMLLGPVPDGFRFLPKHKANSYDGVFLF